MGKSKIEWTDETWNPVTGCSKVSPGCENCYAERQALGRLKGSEGYPGLPWTARNAATNVVLHPKRLDAPLRSSRPRRYFVNSMSDLFHERVPNLFIASVFVSMKMASQHVFQVLTKRPERMHEFMRGYGEPSKNVWLGVSVEDQKRADERIPLLLDTPAAVRFLSVEPLLGPVDLMWPETLWPDGPPTCCPGHDCACGGHPIEPPLLHRIDWVIVGGESGPGARPMNPNWVRSIRDQCVEAGVPFFFKQWGEWAPDARALEIVHRDLTTIATTNYESVVGYLPGMVRVGKNAAGRELDGRTWDEMPKAEIRDMPLRRIREPEGGDGGDT